MINGILIKTAWAAGLVPCEGADCTKADFYQLIVNVIEFAIKYLAFPLVVLFFLIGGFILLTSGGSPTRVEQGKKAITGAVVGLVIVLISVVVINTFLYWFTDCWNVQGKKEFDFSQIGIISCPGIESREIKATDSGQSWWKRAIQSTSPQQSGTGGGGGGTGGEGDGGVAPQPPQTTEPPRQVPRGGQSIPE